MKLGTLLKKYFTSSLIIAYIATIHHYRVSMFGLNFYNLYLVYVVKCVSCVKGVSELRRDTKLEWLINRNFSNAINRLSDVKNAINRLIAKLIAYYNIIIYQ